MSEKQKQEVGDNSSGVQVQGDYHGPSYLEIREIFQDLFHLNFPKVQEVAAQKAQERVDAMLEQFRESLDKNKDSIDPDKLTEPSVQYEMQAIAVDVARRGEKSNVELLCELMSTVLTKDCPELIELISGEARRVLPMLSKKHVAYLSLEVLVNEATVDDATLNQLDAALNDTLNYISDALEITVGDLQYVACTRAIETCGIMTTGIVPNIVKSVEEHKDKKREEIVALCDATDLSNIKWLFEFMDNCHIGRFQLMAVGRLIGWLNLARFSKVDIKTLF